MKIFIHELHYRDYEDSGSLKIITNKEMGENEFVKFYNENYAGKAPKEVEGLYYDMYLDHDDDGNEILPEFYVDEEETNSDIGYKYKKKGDKYSEVFKFFATKVNVKEM